MKRKLLKTILCLTICSSVFTGLFSHTFIESFAVSKNTQNAIDKAEEEKEQLEKELEEQEETKNNLQDKKETEEQKLRRLRQEYQAISDNLDVMQEEQLQKEEEIKTKEEEIKIALKLQEKQYEDMKKRIQYMYEKPQQSILALFFGDLGMAKILNRVELAFRIQEYDRNQMDLYIETTENLEQQQKDLEEDKKELASMIEDAKVQQEKVETLREKTKVSISQYLNQIAQTEDEIGDTKEALEKKAEALKKLYAQAQAEENSKGQAEEAAKRLQEALANGTLKIDDAGIIRGPITLTDAEMEMLIAMIYCESRGESYEGQLAVGHVIMNRVRSSKFPNTLEEVLRANRQFEPAGSGRFDIVLTAYREGIPGVIGQAEWESCKRAAEACVNGESNVKDCLFFRTHKPVPQLAENLELAGVPYWIIGNHIFYYSWVNY